MSPATPRRHVALLLLAATAACGGQPPAVAEIRAAYADHMKRDRVHERGLGASEAPVVIPQQEPGCRSDGGGHFDCRIRVIYESARGPRSEEQMVHIRRDKGSWTIDSIN